jgi:hypothetical protein
MKQSKLQQVRVQVGKDVDMGKLITQIQTLINKSRMVDRIEIFLNNEPVPKPAEEAEDTSLL